MLPLFIMSFRSYILEIVHKAFLFVLNIFYLPRKHHKWQKKLEVHLIISSCLVTPNVLVMVRMYRKPPLLLQFILPFTGTVSHELFTSSLGLLVIKGQSRQTDCPLDLLHRVTPFSWHNYSPLLRTLTQSLSYWGHASLSQRLSSCWGQQTQLTTRTSGPPLMAWSVTH